jgi:hypothetical protein
VANKTTTGFKQKKKELGERTDTIEELEDGEQQIE